MFAAAAAAAASRMLRPVGGVSITITRSLSCLCLRPIAAAATTVSPPQHLIFFSSSSSSSSSFNIQQHIGDGGHDLHVLYCAPHGVARDVPAARDDSDDDDDDSDDDFESDDDDDDDDIEDEHDDLFKAPYRDSDSD